MFDILRGLVLNPILVAAARGILEAAAMAGLITAGEAVAAGNLPDWVQPYAFIFVFLLRQAEGIADKIDPAKQRRRDLLRDSPLTDEDGNPFPT